ncbi:MAG: hypothetical protein GY801_32570, partial [bacterium]|nr:hypothetical protein [bacterium]
MKKKQIQHSFSDGIAITFFILAFIMLGGTRGGLEMAFGQNLLMNPSFEIVGQNGFPNDWTSFQMDPTGTIEWDTSIAHDGTSS